MRFAAAGGAVQRTWCRAKDPRGTEAAAREAAAYDEPGTVLKDLIFRCLAS